MSNFKFKIYFSNGTNGEFIVAQKDSLYEANEYWEDLFKDKTRTLINDTSGNRWDLNSIVKIELIDPMSDKARM